MSPAASGMLDPGSLNPDQAIPVARLKREVLAWQDVGAVTVTGYPNLFFDGGSIGTRIELLAEPGSDKRLAEVTLKEEDTKERSKDRTITIRRTLEKDFGGKLVIKNAVLLSDGDAPVRVRYVSPDQLKPETAYFIEDLYNSCCAWNGKTVSVVGTYNGTTTSTTAHGVTVRIDLIDPETRERSVGCNMKTDPTALLKDNREGVIVKGVVKGEVSGYVSMEECVLVNR